MIRPADSFDREHADWLENQPAPETGRWHRALVVALVYALIACYVYLLSGCTHASSPSTATPAEYATATTTPAKAAQTSTADATTAVRSADARAATLQSAATTRPALPSAEVTAAVIPLRGDLAAALARLGDATRAIADTARAALDMGAKLAEKDKLIAAADERARKAEAGEHRVWTYLVSGFIGLAVAWGAYEAGTGLTVALVIGGIVGGLIPFVIDDIRPWLKWGIGVAVFGGTLFALEAKHKGGWFAALHDRFNPAAGKAAAIPPKVA